MPERNFLSQIDLFASGEGGYHTYRIPALATTAEGTVLAFCEGILGLSTEGAGTCLVYYRSRKKVKPPEIMGFMEDGFRVFELFASGRPKVP